MTGCHNIESILGLLAFSNSAINPILYSFLGHSFRSRLRETIATLSRRWRRNSSIKSAGGNVRTPQSNSDNSVSVFDCIYKANVNTHRWVSGDIDLSLLLKMMWLIILCVMCPASRIKVCENVWKLGNYDCYRNACIQKRESVVKKAKRGSCRFVPVFQTLSWVYLAIIGNLQPE